MLLALALSLAAGTVIVEIVNGGIALLWETIPSQWDATPAWYVFGLLLIGAGLVYVIRRFLGDTGHSPLGGITVSPYTPSAYLAAILAILASLWGGAVLGPEVALVATGALIGGLVCRGLGVLDAARQKTVVGVGSLGGLLALFVGPALSGSLHLGSPPTVEVDQLAWAVGVALVATVIVTLARVAAGLLDRVTGGGPHFIALLGAGAVVALCAVIVHARTELPVVYIATSGEELISELPTLTSLSAVLSIVLFKSIAYAVSLGSGLRGGPFLPAMFVGASVGLAAALTLPHGPSVPAGIAVGVVAGVIATARMSWRVALILGVVLGFLMGSWTLIPATIVGAIVARLIPRWGDRITRTAH